MFILVFLVFGLIAFLNMPLNMMPDIQLPFILIQTVYPGAGPADMETQITKRIEDAVATVSQIDYIESYSMESVSIVFISFKLGKNVDIANQEVKDKVDAILRDLPRDVEKPLVSKFEINAFPFMDILLEGDLDGKALYEIADTRLKDRFAQIEGVARVDMIGGNKRQINVSFSDKTIFENNLSLMQLMQILGAQNLDMPGGSFDRGDQEYSVRLKGEIADLNDLRNLEIPTAHGIKKLSQIAAVEDGIAVVRERATYFNVPQNRNSDNIVRLSLIKSSDGNVVNIAKQVRDQLPMIQEELPVGVQIKIIRDNSEFIRSVVSDTLSNIWLGILFTGLILFIFLHDLRSTIIVALSMPISILSTFLFLRASNFTTNVMTLMGLSTSVGILVTNSVVVIENIFRHKQMGNNKREAADRGTSETALAVIASTLTNIVVFLPIATMSSMVGQFFKEFGLTVTYATIFSLITSFTITPMLASLIIPEKQIDTKFGRGFERGFKRFSHFYQRVLGSVIKNRKRCALVLISAVVALGLSFGLISSLGSEMMPTLDQGDVNISVELPQGYNLDQTASVMSRINERISKYQEVEHIVTNLGTQGFIDRGANLASADVKLIDYRARTRKTREMIDVFMVDLANIPNAAIKVQIPESFGGGGSPIEFYIQGQEIERLEALKDIILTAIKDTPGLINLDSSSRTGKAEITIRPNRDKLAQAGATVFDLAMALRVAIEGMVATNYREGGAEYSIHLSLDKEAVDSPDKIRNLPVAVLGKTYLLSQLAEIYFETGASKIIHRDRYKSIQIGGGIADGFNLGDVMAQINQELDRIEMPAGYRIYWGGEAEMLKETMIDMMRTFLLAILLTYMLLAAILESFSQPLLIMVTVPLALIGVILALIVTGFSINVFSMMAIIMLVGIVVNNAILILDYTNMKRRQGANTHDAILEAGVMKLKPIIMSTVSIIIGMMPMALGVGSAGKEFRQSMGIVSIGGMVISSILTLFIIPVFYSITTKQYKTHLNDKSS